MSAVHSSALRDTPAARAPGPARIPPAPRRASAPPRPRLRVVRAPAQARTRVPFVLLCMTVLVGALLGALLLNTAMAQGEYERFALSSSLARSAQEQQQISEQLEQARSSPALASAARAIGMVPSTDGGYLRLDDGVVLGEPRPAGEGE